MKYLVKQEKLSCFFSISMDIEKRALKNYSYSSYPREIGGPASRKI